MNENTPLVDDNCLLEKFPGKGGWTYSRIPVLSGLSRSPFGWVRVRGTIDSYAIEKYNLMPIENDKLFLPVKAAIRKALKKEAGDFVRVTLFADQPPQEIMEEFRLCLQDEPKALASFLSYSVSEQNAITDWIHAAKTEEIKVERIVISINKILKEKK